MIQGDEAHLASWHSPAKSTATRALGQLQLLQVWHSALGREKTHPAHSDCICQTHLPLGWRRQTEFWVLLLIKGCCSLPSLSPKTMGRHQLPKNATSSGHTGALLGYLRYLDPSSLSTLSASAPPHSSGWCYRRDEQWKEVFSTSSWVVGVGAMWRKGVFLCVQPTGAQLWGIQSSQYNSLQGNLAAGWAPLGAAALLSQPGVDVCTFTHGFVVFY